MPVTDQDAPVAPARIRPPRFWQSIRFRLTVLYSTLLFAIAALVVGIIYFGVVRQADARPITKTYEAERVIRGPDGTETPAGTLEVAAVREVESAVNYQTSQTLKRYSVVVLGGLFATSLGIGWVLSGRALRPVRTIVRTAEDIQATDLSRRIELGGPRDELRRLADSINSMLDRLDTAFRAERQFVGDASHELRTPLAIIQANLDAVLTRPGTTPAQHDRAVAIIGRATTRMTRLVEDLLATARRAAPAFVDIDVELGRLVREAGEEFEPLAAAKGVSLGYELEDGVVVIGDRDALRCAAGNLLSNAVRFAPEGSEVTIGLGSLDGWRWLAVRDHGPGIPDEDHDQVFGRFWRGASEGRSDGHSGLGLAIVRQIVEAHGGHVRLHSRPGHGSTFVLWLPEQPAGHQRGAVPEGNPLAHDESQSVHAFES